MSGDEGGLAFFDTNVLVYADDATSPNQQEKAIAVFAGYLRRGTAVVSLQVLQEYFAVATRKLGLAPEVAQRKWRSWLAPVVPFDAGDVIAAFGLHRLTQVSFWDALIVHAARSAGARVLFSEDVHAGTILGGVRVVNRFAT